MTLLIKSNSLVTNSAQLPVADFSDLEETVAEIASLTGWWEAEYAYLRNYDLADPVVEFEWQPKVGVYPLRPLFANKPLLVAGSHGRGAMQFGYGAPNSHLFNGALGADPAALLLSASAYTRIVVARVPASAGAETVGGYLTSSYGPNGYDTPHVGVDSADGSNTGKLQISGSGTSVEDAANNRNGVWFLATEIYDGGANTLALRKDGTPVGSTAATVDLNTGVAGIRSLEVGVGGPVGGPGVFFLTGQISAVMTFNAALSGSALTDVETMLKARYSIA